MQHNPNPFGCVSLKGRFAAARTYGRWNIVHQVKFSIDLEKFIYIFEATFF
jgi:hypothetical protein